jgi:alpha-L-fucosidase
MRLHERSIRGCGASSYDAPADCRYTQNGDRLYLHLFSWPFKHVHLPGLAGKVSYVQLLSDGSEIQLVEHDETRAAENARPGAQPPGTLTLELPVRRPEVAVPVIELFL